MRTNFGHRKDGNHNGIAQAFRDRGFSVRDTHTIGDGFPDMVVAKHGQNILIEIKDPGKPPSKRKLTRDEVVFSETWKGWYEIVETLSDVNVVEIKVIMVRTQQT